ncbi:hypothetical protein cyc_00058 [Cyclospora cayetanensis]|uniref:Uncharacterized protein n=1 Tax=Cyclospora cayetanensis TaxID=88456 RepID=A0A1D3CVI0_9EIME|nr:hypothetical protein cyc_00058 [Cyclospora cayetanensis]
MDEGAQSSQDLQRRHVPTEQELQPGWWMQLRNALKADLRSGMPVLQCLALQHVGVACLSRSPRGAEAAATTADELLPLVNGLANPAGRSPPCCRQRAYAALLCLYKASPRQQKEHQQQEGVWIYRLTQCLMIEQDSDALLGLSHLLMELLLRKRCARSDRSSHGKKQSVHSPRAIDDATGGWEALLQLLPAPTAAAEIQTANQTLRLCFDRIAQAGTLNRPSTAGRRRWPFSRSFGGNSGSAAASVSSSATATMRLQQRGSLWTRAVARSRTAAASLRRSASVSRAAAGSADQQQELHQQGFDVPLLHAAMLIEVAKAALSLGQAIAPDVVERAIDIISILVADPRADVRLTAAEGILSLLHDRSKISRFAFLLPAALELAAEPTDLVLQQAGLETVEQLVDATTWEEAVTCLLQAAIEGPPECRGPPLATAAKITVDYASTSQYLEKAFEFLSTVPLDMPPFFWRRIALLLTQMNPKPELQQLAVIAAVDALRSPHAQTPLIRLCCYLIGEFHEWLRGAPGGPSGALQVVFAHLRRRSRRGIEPFAVSVAAAHPKERPLASSAIALLLNHWDFETQTRAHELQALPPDEALLCHGGEQLVALLPGAQQQQQLLLRLVKPFLVQPQLEVRVLRKQNGGDMMVSWWLLLSCVFVLVVVGAGGAIVCASCGFAVGPSWLASHESVALILRHAFSMRVGLEETLEEWGICSSRVRTYETLESAAAFLALAE